VTVPRQSLSFSCLAHILREAAARAMTKAERLLEAHRNRRGIARLAQCDDRMLQDIGLTRPQVMGALAAPYGEDPSDVLLRSTSPRRGA